ncbi:MAG: hypothetical protein SH850_15845 [Planctomycetaceae bacterium]|nr:hypothetical protein [Planctomycetaceae bacterium]
MILRDATCPAAARLIPVLGLAFCLGCGDAKTAAKTAGGGGQAATTSPKPQAVDGDAEPTTKTSSGKHVRIDADGRKWIGDIPYDVFFDDPLAVVSNAATVPTMSPGGTPPVAPQTPSTPSPTTPAGGVADWKSMISMDQLVDETKRVRNHLTSSLQSQGTYNGNYKELQVDGAVMAAIAGIVAQHPDDVSWKPNARYVKDYGHKLFEASKALGREPYEQSQTSAEGLAAVLSGNLPADAGDPADKPFGEVAHRAGVMKRIEKASEWMRSNIDSETVFKKEKDQILTEATLLAVLGKVVSDPSYESADEDDYKGFAQRLIDGGRDAVTATQEQAYPKFQEAINKITKACADCHANYGNG